MRCARLLVQASLSLWGSPIPPFSTTGDWSAARKRTLQVLSRHRAGARVALQQAPYPPARRIDCLQETWWKSTSGRALLIEFNLRRDLNPRGVRLLTINKERT